MKLALIRRQFSSKGGAELYLQRLMRELSVRGVHLSLIAQDMGDAPAGVTFHRTAAGGSRGRSALRFDSETQSILAAHDFDCVFSLERTSSQEVYRAGDGVHRVWLEQRRKYSPWWRRPFIGRGTFHRNMLGLESATFDPANTRRVIVNSLMVKREILRCFAFPENRIHLVRNGVDVTRMRSGDRAGTRTRLGVGDEEFLLLFAGSGWERKGLGYVLAALRKLRDPRVKLLVAGKGRRSWFTPANAIFAGPMADVENAYAAADLLVFPPIYEPSANVCFEALAAGLPVVTSACNGAAEILDEGVNGTVLAEPSDVDAIVNAIRYWQARPHLRPIPVNYDLSIERNVRETLSVLEGAAAERAAAKGR